MTPTPVLEDSEPASNPPPQRRLHSEPERVRTPAPAHHPGPHHHRAGRSGPDQVSAAPRFVATVTVPGTTSTPAEEITRDTFPTPVAAWWHLYHARCRAELDAPCDLCHDTMTHGPMGDCDDDSETGTTLAKRARAAGSGLVTDSEAVGTVHGPTPGRDGHPDDLGLFYAVAEVTD